MRSFWRVRRKTLRYGYMRQCGIGENYLDASFDDIPKDYKCRRIVFNYLTNMFECLDQGIGLTLVGPNGHGKTHISNVILKEALRYGAEGLFVEADFLSSTRIEQTRMERLPEWTYFDRARHVDMLVLDDLGSEHLSKYDRRLMEGLVRYRCARNKCTIITTNLKAVDTGRGKDLTISNVYGGSMLAVLKEKNKTVLVRGHDWRPSKEATVDKLLDG